MKIYVWRHNKKFHSYSMINEPCVNNNFYQDAVAVVAAESKQQALELLADLDEGWRTEDLACLEPRVLELHQAGVLFTDLNR